MLVLDKAKELAEAIAASEELAAMREAEALIEQDQEALDIIQEFRRVQQDIFNKQQQGIELSDEDRQLVEEIEEKMSRNESIQRYIAAQERLERLLQSVNFIISQAFNPPADCESCSPGCNGCH